MSIPYKLKEIKIEVTHECLLNCVHCSSMANSKCARKMEWNICKKIINDAAKMGVSEVTFSGGEPLLWTHLINAVSLARDLNINVSIYTTGNVPNVLNLLTQLKSKGVERIVVSIFGVDSIQHEKITCVKGSYKQTIKVAKESVILGFYVEYHFVPVQTNYNSLITIAHQASESGVKRMSVLRLVPQGRGSNYADLLLDHKQNLDLRADIINLRNQGFDIRLGSPYNFLMLNENPKCFSGINRLTIGPDLRIFPCDAFKHITPEMLDCDKEYSDLNMHSLAECWNKSSYLQKVREYIETPIGEVCSICNDRTKCQSGCMAQKFYAYGSLRKVPDPLCLHKSAELHNPEQNRVGGSSLEHAHGFVLL